MATASSPKGSASPGRHRERLDLLRGPGVSAEGFKLTVTQINWVRADAMSKPDAEFYLRLICFYKP